MHFLVVLALLLALVSVVFWVFMDRPKQQLETVWNNLATTLKLNPQDRATPLKMWAQESLGTEPKLQAWLLALPDEGLQALGEKVHEFGADMDLDLQWLVDPEFEGVPEAQQAAEEMVVDYCKLCMKAVQTH